MASTPPGQDSLMRLSGGGVSRHSATRGGGAALSRMHVCSLIGTFTTGGCSRCQAAGCGEPRIEAVREKPIETIASSIAAARQPRGQALPQLLPDGLTPEAHLAAAKLLDHPMADRPPLPAWCNAALAAQGVEPLRL